MSVETCAVVFILWLLQYSAVEFSQFIYIILKYFLAVKSVLASSVTL